MTILRGKVIVEDSLPLGLLAGSYRRPFAIPGLVEKKEGMIADTFEVPDCVTSEECRERRTAFIERRKIDPSKNLPYVKIPIR